MSRSITLILPGDLVTAIDNYNATDWLDGRDPSKLGALNAVAYIGERVAAIRKSKEKAGAMTDGTRYNSEQAVPLIARVG